MENESMAVLEVSALNVYYGLRHVLKSVAFDLSAGSILGLIGPNGAGKSTLIRAISGVAPVRSGQIFLGGHALAQLTSPQRARWLAVVSQARNLPPAFTAWETVALGRTPYLNWLGQISEQDQACISRAMTRTDTLELADRRVGELSGGEQQRLLLARALAQSAPILLMDEPTTHLDLQHQINILNLVRELAHQDGLAVLVALHDLNLVARYTDRVMLILDGEIQAQGTPEEVLRRDILSSAYHLPLRVIPNGQGNYPLIIPD
jgi:ABC-type cobalamin/Fe3+-siderophores transport system ATPase subunit